MDHLQDKGYQRLHQLSRQYLGSALPEFIKAANLSKEKPAAGMPLAVWGNPVNRTFPCHTKTATWLSHLYFWGQRPTETWGSSFPIEKTAERLDRAAQYWSIKPEIRRLKGLIEKQASDPARELVDDDFALVVNYGNQRIRRFPLVNAITVKKAAQNLRRNRGSYPYTWRKRAALNIIKRAMGLSAVLEPEDLEYLVKASGAYPGDIRDIATGLMIRAYLMPEQARPIFRKAAAAVQEGRITSFEKLCCAIDMADREYKQYVLYRDGLAMPEELCFQHAPCTKRASVEVELQTGNRYRLDDVKLAGLEPFRAIGDVYVQAVLTQEGALDITKAASVLKSIPRDDAKLLDRAYEAMGVKPVTTEKQAARDISHDLSLEELQRFFGDKFGTESREDVPLRHTQDTHEALTAKQQGSGDALRV